MPRIAYQTLAWAIFTSARWAWPLASARRTAPCITCANASGPPGLGVAAHNMLGGP